jgi:hypothetical protein
MAFEIINGIRRDLTPENEAAFEASRAVVPTAADVEIERKRRLAAGFDYAFPDARGTHRIGTTDADMAGWSEVTMLAGAMIAAGQPAGTIAIVTNTGPATVTAIEWQSILLAAAAFRQPIWAASFALQAMSPIPADYADDAHWVGRQ